MIIFWFRNTELFQLVAQQKGNHHFSIGNKKMNAKTFQQVHKSSLCDLKSQYFKYNSVLIIKSKLHIHPLCNLSIIAWKVRFIISRCSSIGLVNFQNCPNFKINVTPTFHFYTVRQAISPHLTWFCSLFFLSAKLWLNDPEMTWRQQEMQLPSSEESKIALQARLGLSPSKSIRTHTHITLTDVADYYSGALSINALTHPFLLTSHVASRACCHLS